MASLKEVRTRIISVQGTRQITSAMKMVSAARLRKAQDMIIKMRPYANKLMEILLNLTQSLENTEDTVFGTKSDVKKVLIFAISSNKGLCGAFNLNVAKRVIQLLESDYKNLYNQNQVDIIIAGKKVAEQMRNKGYTISETQHDILDHLSYELVKSLAKRIMFSFETGVYGEVKIVYNQFRNAVVQNIVVEQYLPVVSPDSSNKEQYYFDYILEPSQKEIVSDLIPKSLKIQLYKAFLESFASEHGARMTAMHKATDNASDMIKSLQLEYNKARQASITKEILEIVGGSEALKG